MNSRWMFVALAVAFAVWGWVDVRRRAETDPTNSCIHKTDFTVYTEAGSAFFDGRDPYTVTNARGWGYLYLPLFALLVAPLHHLASQWQALAWFFLSAWMAWGCYREIVRMGRLVTTPGSADVPRWFGYGALAAGALPALNCMQRGQVGIAQLYLLLLGFRLLLESRSLWKSFAAGIILSVPIAIKITPLLPVGFLLFQQFIAAVSANRRRPTVERAAASWLGTTLGMVLCVLVIPASLVGWQANLGHLHTWWERVAMKIDQPGDAFAGDAYSFRNQSLSNAVRHLGNWADHTFGQGADDRPTVTPDGQEQNLLMASESVDAMLMGIEISALILLLGVAWCTARSGDLLAQAAGFGLACAATLVISPIARAHYFVLLLPVLPLLPRYLAGKNRTRAAFWLAAVPVALMLAHYLFLNFAGRIGLLGIGTAVWYAVASVMLIRTAGALGVSQATEGLATELCSAASRRSFSRRAAFARGQKSPEAMAAGSSSV